MLLVKSKSSNKIGYYLFLISLGLLFYIINTLTPYFSDDWHYGFIFGTTVRIESIEDVLTSQCSHYFYMNGRFVPHFLLQLIYGVIGKSVFNIINACMFMLFFHLLNVNFVPQKEKYLVSTVISSFLVLFFMCGFTNGFLWMSGACNYLWAFVFILSFNVLFVKKIDNVVLLPFLFIYGIICGWQNEAVVVGYLCYMIYSLIKERKYIVPSRICLSIGFCVGAALLCFAPGSIHRASLSSGDSFSFVSTVVGLCRSLFYMSNLRIFFIACIMLVFYRNCRDSKLIFAACVSFLFVWMTKHDSGHSRLGIEFFSLIIILHAIPFERIHNIVTASIAVAVCLLLVASIPYCLQNNKDFKRVEQQISHTSDGIIIYNDIEVPIPCDRFVLHFLSKDCIWGWNKSIATFYECQTPLFFLPYDIMNDINKGESMNLFRFPSPYAFFYVREWDKTEEIHSVTFELAPSKYSNIPIIGSLSQFKLNKLSTDKYQTIEINGKTYLFVVKNPIIDERVVSIEVN